MPITKSAKKALRQSARKKVVNLKRKREMKSVVKELLSLKSLGKSDDASKLISTAYKAIDKAAKGGVIKKRTAARKKSRIAKCLVAKK